jgi:threonine synthase
VRPIDYAHAHDQLPPDGHGTTIADSIDVHVPRNWHKAVRAIREADGVMISATDEAILDAMRLAGRHGVFAEPAAAAALAGVVAAIESKTILSHDRVLTMITGSGLKDTRSAIRAAGRPIVIEPTVTDVAAHINGN